MALIKEGINSQKENFQLQIATFLVKQRRYSVAHGCAEKDEVNKQEYILELTFRCQSIVIR